MICQLWIMGASLAGMIVGAAIAYFAMVDALRKMDER